MSADLPPPFVSFGPVQSLIYLRAGDYFTADQMRAYATKAVASQAAELEALRADAERYRFLRDKAWGKDGALALLPANEMDEAVDAARAALKEQEPNAEVNGGRLADRPSEAV